MEDFLARLSQNLMTFIFLIYINDLPEGIKYSSYRFADDVSLFSVFNPAESTQILNEDSNGEYNLILA